MNRYHQRHPLEYVVPAFMALAGIFILCYGGPPRTIDEVLHEPFQIAWAFMLAVGALTTFCAVVWKGRYIVALGIEQVGDWLISGSCFIYAIALIAAGATTAFLALCFTLAIGSAYTWQIVRIMRTTRRIVAASKVQIEVEGE